MMLGSVALNAKIRGEAIMHRASCQGQWYVGRCNVERILTQRSCHHIWLVDLAKAKQSRGQLTHGKRKRPWRVCEINETRIRL